MQARDIMTKAVETCRPDSDLQEVAKLMVDRDCGSVPVTAADGRVVGIVTDRDIVVRTLAKGENPLDKRVADVMTESVITVSETDDIQECERAMREHQLRRIVVVNDQDEITGIIAQADLAQRTSPEETGDVVQNVSMPKR